MYSLNWPYAYGTPPSTAHFKLMPEDFHVDELVDGEFSGEGEHILLKIEKRGLTTEDVVSSLARLTKKPAKLISYAGLKDRQAITTQWLSLHAPGEEIAGLGALEAPGWKVLEHTRHNKKLRPGFLLGNQFMVRLRDVSEIEDLLKRMALIQITGVPNYFGEQRFGRESGNLIHAEGVLVKGQKVKSRFLKGMYFSAARSWIFNLVLAKRVQDGSWNTPLDGDIMQLTGSNSIFTRAEDQGELIRRIKEKDISPASPLPGKAKTLVTGEAFALINEIYTDWMPWINGLEKQGLEEAWRANILHVTNMRQAINGNDVELTFTLPPGSYATVVLRELVNYTTGRNSLEQ